MNSVNPASKSSYLVPVFLEANPKKTPDSYETAAYFGKFVEKYSKKQPKALHDGVIIHILVCAGIELAHKVVSPERRSAS